MGLTSFERRLLSVLSAFFVLQALGFVIFRNFYQVSAPWDWAFFPLTAGYHAILAVALLSVRKRFTHLDGTPLTRVGLPNLLTLFRLTSLPIIALIFLLARTQPSLSLPLVIFVSLAFFTDLLDGFLARSLKMGTQLGKILDSSTDYTILFSLTVVLGVAEVLPVYLLIAIMVRLLFQMSAVLWIQLAFNKQFVETTWLGKASLFVLMVLFAVEILVFLRLPGWEGHWAITTLEIFSAVTMVISTIDKALFFRKKLTEK